jgi:hypothetical protein
MARRCLSARIVSILRALLYWRCTDALAFANLFPTLRRDRLALRLCFSSEQEQMTRQATDEEEGFFASKWVKLRVANRRKIPCL